MGQQAFDNFRIVPPGTGICHQVNLEYLSKVVWTAEYKNENYLFLIHLLVLTVIPRWLMVYQF